MLTSESPETIASAMNVQELLRCADNLESLVLEQESTNPNVHVLNAVRMHVRSAEFAAKGDQRTRQYLASLIRVAVTLYDPAKTLGNLGLSDERRRLLHHELLETVASIRQWAKTTEEIQLSRGQRI